jgi:hypothetical protein
MRVFPPSTVPSLMGLVALGLALTGCPEKAGAPAEKTGAEPERVEPDDGDEKSKKPAAAAPPAAPAAADEKKPDENKDEGGW